MTDVVLGPGALALLAFGAFAANALNSVAGGGTLISFPIAIAVGLPPVLADTTNTAALTPGQLASAVAYRSSLEGQWRVVGLLAIPIAVGSILGAVLLILAPAHVFEALAPWLVLGASCVLLAKDTLFKKTLPGPPTTRRIAWVAAAIFPVAVYGGYFGAGFGILSLAVLAFLGELDIHQLNAQKTVLGAIVNGVATLYFLAAGTVHVPGAMAMTAGAVAGGYWGAKLARKVQPDRLRRVVVGLGVLMSVVLAVKLWTAG
jgi:uncharacterized membrane protein YfcA